MRKIYAASETCLLIAEADRVLFLLVMFVSAVVRPNGQLRQAGAARGVWGHAPPRNFEL